MRKIRLALAVVILMISVGLLFWGFSPNAKETRIQNILPSEMQLPTPSSYHFELERIA